MPRKTKNQDGYFIKMNNNNIHLDVNNASKIEKNQNIEINTPEMLNISTLRNLTISGKQIVSVKAILINIKENIIKSSKNKNKKQLHVMHLT